MTVDVASTDWIEVFGGPESSYPIHHHYAILGYDRAAGVLDLLVRFDDRGGHCQAHRHVCPTSVLVLDGEQHVFEQEPGGPVVHKVRKAGEHHLMQGDQLPHRERGGPAGAIVFFSHHSADGRLYDVVDDDGTTVATVTIDSLVQSWEHR